jgi:hypothetical protein
MAKVKWKVELLESYADGTIVVDRTKYFDDEVSAHEFSITFNKENANTMYYAMRPDWFMYASLPKKVKV